MVPSEWARIGRANPQEQASTATGRSSNFLVCFDAEGFVSPDVIDRERDCHQKKARTVFKTSTIPTEPGTLLPLLIDTKKRENIQIITRNLNFNLSKKNKHPNTNHV